MIKKDGGQLTVIGSYSKSYVKRLLSVYAKI